MSKLSRAIKKAHSCNGPTFLQGTFQQSETLDSNLSQVTVLNTTLTFVRKLEHVTGLATGDAVLMVKSPSIPLTIIGVIVGNIDIMNIETAP